MTTNTLNTPLTESQLYMLRLMGSLDEKDLQEVKKMVRRYLAEKLTRLADEAWERNEWTAEEETKLLATHLWTPSVTPQPTKNFFANLQTLPIAVDNLIISIG